MIQKLREFSVICKTQHMQEFKSQENFHKIPMYFVSLLPLSGAY